MTRPVDDDRFELFAFWRTSAAFRVRVAFNLKGVRPRETFVDMDAGEQHGPAYRRISPLGGIPALIDHGPGQPPVPLTQSLAILEFLDELYPQPPLLPADAHGREHLRAVEQRLATEPGTGRFCHGDQPTMADICLASLFMVTRVLKIDVDGIPTATRIVDECGRLEAFAAAAPERQAGAPAA